MYVMHITNEQILSNIYSNTGQHKTCRIKAVRSSEKTKQLQQLNSTKTKVSKTKINLK